MESCQSVPWVGGVEYNNHLNDFVQSIDQRKLAAEIFSGAGNTLEFAKHFASVFAVDLFPIKDGINPVAVIGAKSIVDETRIVPLRVSVDSIPRLLYDRIFDFVHIRPHNGDSLSVRFAVEQWHKVTRYLAVPTRFSYMVAAVAGGKEIFSSSEVTGFSYGPNGC